MSSTARLLALLAVPALADCAGATDPDADGDGLADVWEVENGLSIETDDSDGHGHSESTIEQLLDEPIPEVQWYAPPALEDVTDGVDAAVGASASEGSFSGLDPYSATPYGGASCSAAGGGASRLALLHPLGIRRRR